MVFSGLTFLYLFLPAVFVLYFLTPARIRNAVLLLASLFFYFYGEQVYLILMICDIVLTYFAGLAVERFSGAAKKAVLILFFLFTLGMLGVFKYADLFSSSVNAIAGAEVIKVLRLHMPIGISFYSFQSISYGIDVYRKKHPAERNILRLATYVSLFPQLIAGPIVRYDDVSRELCERKTELSSFGKGAFRFVLGLGKKVLLADRLFAFCQSASAVKEGSLVLAWAEGFAFLLYVYFDFSGYSDMAIGLGKCFGFQFPENFDYPLISKSIKEFWRRWHISLGTWFRDYLYIPLGGNRRGTILQIRNLLIVWAFTGLWHGASWNYVIWGLSFGILLVSETLFSKKREKADRAGLWRSVPRRILVSAVAAMIVVWFRFQSFGEAIRQLGSMFGSSPLWSEETAYLLKSGAVMISVSLLGATPLPKRLVQRIAATKPGSRLAAVLRPAFMLLILGLSTAYLVDGSFSPFLYFRF